MLFSALDSGPRHNVAARQNPATLHSKALDPLNPQDNPRWAFYKGSKLYQDPPSSLLLSLLIMGIQVEVSSYVVRVAEHGAFQRRGFPASKNSFGVWGLRGFYQCLEGITVEARKLEHGFRRVSLP